VRSAGNNKIILSTVGITKHVINKNSCGKGRVVFLAGNKFNFHTVPILIKST
jgi:hypothetical protein